MLRVNVDVKGPIADGRAGRILDDYAEAVAWAVAVEGRIMLGVRFLHKFRYESSPPTGYYEAHVKPEHHGNRAVIHDSRVIYGPWLEGTGSRNFPKTRFVGYWSFKTITGELNQGKAVEVAYRVLPPYLARLRGEGR